MEEEERELTPQEGEQLRRATAWIRQVQNSQVQSVLTHISRTGALAKFSADMNTLGRPNLPGSALKTMLGKSLPASTFQQLLPNIAEEPPWMKQIKLINSDIYKMSGLGQSNLTNYSSLLAKNADFGFDKTAAKLVEQFAAGQTSSLSPNRDPSPL